MDTNCMARTEVELQRRVVGWQEALVGKGPKVIAFKKTGGEWGNWGEMTGTVCDKVSICKTVIIPVLV